MWELRALFIKTLDKMPSEEAPFVESVESSQAVRRIKIKTLFFTRNARAMLSQFCSTTSYDLS